MKSKLVIDADIFSQKLSKQIVAGKALLAVPVNTFNDFGVLRNECKKWSDFNEELLKLSFSISENEYKDEYKKCFIAFGSIGNLSLDERCKNFKETIQKRIICLESIHNRIEIISIT